MALDVAELRGFDLRAWAACGHQVAKDMLDYQDTVESEGPSSPAAVALERSFELGMGELAATLRYIRSIAREAEHARS